MTELSAANAADVAGILDPETAGKILSRMEPSHAAIVINDMPAPEASMVLAAMDPDDRVDVLEHVPEPRHGELMEFTQQDADEVRQLEQYPPDTAGGIMTTQVTSLPEDITCEEAVAQLRRLNEEQEQMFYVYVVDRRGHLIGVLSMRDLILSKPDRRVNQIMHPNVTSVPATMDQEEVARTMRRHKYLAVPVVDVRHRLLGIITLDDIVEVITDEATEDVQKMFGAGAEERLLSPWQFSFRKRIWWLEVNLATAFLAAWVVSWFDDVINALPILAAYQGIVSGMGGNAGASVAVAIRGIALGENAPRLLLRGSVPRICLRSADRHRRRSDHLGLRRCGNLRTRHVQKSRHALRHGDVRRFDAQSHQRLRHRRVDSVRHEKTRLRSRSIRNHLRHHLHRLRWLLSNTLAGEGNPASSSVSSAAKKT